MILPDHEITKLLAQDKLIVQPLDTEIEIQPAGIDLWLWNEFRVFKATPVPYMDTRKACRDYTELVRVEGVHSFVINLRQFAPGIIREYMRLRIW